MFASTRGDNFEAKSHWMHYVYSDCITIIIIIENTCKVSTHKSKSEGGHNL